MTEIFERLLARIEAEQLDIYGPLLRMIDHERDGWIYHFELREKDNVQYVRLGTCDGMEHLTLLLFTPEKAIEKILDRVSKMSWVLHGNIVTVNRTKLDERTT